MNSQTILPIIILSLYTIKSCDIKGCALSCCTKKFVCPLKFDDCVFFQCQAINCVYGCCYSGRCGTREECIDPSI